MARTPGSHCHTPGLAVPPTSLWSWMVLHVSQACSTRQNQKGVQVAVLWAQYPVQSRGGRDGAVGCPSSRPRPREQEGT